MDREKIYDHSLRHFLEPVRSLMDDEQVSEIMILGHERVYCERKGRIEQCGLRFPDESWLLAFLRNIAEYTGRTISRTEPTLDARLPDGSRVHAVIPPVARYAIPDPDNRIPDARQGVCITIRRFRRQRFSVAELIDVGTLTHSEADFLADAVRTQRNIMVSGGTGTGKTTLLDALSAEIPDGQRIVVIEDTTELKLKQLHTIYLEAQPSSADERSPLTIRDLFVNSLRMRPDRILIGEVRRGEALDLIQAMLSGHSGSLTTIHACSPSAAVTRLETLCLLGDSSMPLHAVRAQVAAAIDLVVQIARRSDGSRRVTTIAECRGLDEAGRYGWHEIAKQENLQVCTV